MMKIDRVSMTFNQGTPDENQALNNVSLDVHDGDFVTVIGSNGAGKTTLYNAIAGTYTPTEGRIFIRDIDVTRTPEFKRSRYIGRIFQNPLLGTAGKMSLEDNMVICHKKGYKSLKISLNNKLREYFRSRLRELDMGLENRLKDNVELFSGGQRQALTLLMAVLSEPAILLLDEHTAALDPRNAEIVMNLTEKFAKEYKLTVMMITHNMQHALQYGNRLLMMDSGQIVLDIDSEEKSQLTIDGVVQRFRDIKKKELANDQLLLHV
ncbi:MAG TPA: ATP-binding cassette domain-containing protein [Treponemataceae bacterium]|jgi:putative ABC transport system ATP-binding protein|nr:ATP-binding cassette domain-containing protein [Treponema sp.]OQB01887.1 MAG: Carnitine transport ATP-binding protein OpuCA [Spirochaetes bacterium ADurb.Bin215]HOF86195.1 ATP-binding cassette domain-containing protein [Treponemataceae bacterium]HOS35423.1 ATP-binding cassette domain-containing protein [Treponemataceae bacterium]HOU38007.1 ATP-binding cassette domain-containing protein [Treponemataceae bacterium]